MNMKLKYLLCIIISGCILLNYFVLSQMAVYAQEKIIRVGISTNNFSKLEYRSASVRSAGGLNIIDQCSGNTIIKANAVSSVKINIRNGYFQVYNYGKLISSGIVGPLSVVSPKNKPIEIVGLKRAGKPAMYRGKLEIVRAASSCNKLSVVNIISLSDYLKGVVPNEIPVSFGLEAVKAQTVAARNYALRPRIKPYPQFDLCDSVQCQVYFGYNTEQKLSNQAVEETKGLFAMYNNDVILALYSSTAGGYTSNYANAFSNPDTGDFPSEPIPYLTARPDDEETPVLNKEKKAAKFYKSKPFSYDQNSRYFRWHKQWTRTELQNVLKKTLYKQSSTGFIKPKYSAGKWFGKLKNIKVLKRDDSGKIISLQVISNTGIWTVSKELVIRRVFKKSNRAMPSANVVFELTKDKSGNITHIDAYGGGFGHGVGMSQYGAGFMDENGYIFYDILQHYYKGISIGTWPVVLITGTNVKQIEQEFVVLDQDASLVIKNMEDINNLLVKINGKKLNIKNISDQTNILVNIEKYVKREGINKIIYYQPENEEDGKSIRMHVEVIKAKNE